MPRGERPEILPELQGLSYEQRLARLDLPSLEYRRQQFDMIQVFKIINNIDDIDASVFFSYSDNQLRGHSRKLNKPRARKAIRLNSFSTSHHQRLEQFTSRASGIRICHVL